MKSVGVVHRHVELPQCTSTGMKRADILHIVMGKEIRESIILAVCVVCECERESEKEDKSLTAEKDHHHLQLH